MSYLQTPLTLHSQTPTVASTQRGTTMNENGIMQHIRDLFSQGFNAAEIIAQGYAPSTVYRVQRDTRRKSGLNGNSPCHKASTSCGFKHLGNLEADNQRLRQRLVQWKSGWLALRKSRTSVAGGAALNYCSGTGGASHPSGADNAAMPNPYAATQAHYAIKRNN